MLLLYGLRPAPAMPGQEIEQEFYRGSRKRFPRVGRGAPFWGHIEELTLETLSPVANEVPAKHFFSETLLLPGTGIAKMPPERLCWPILGLLLGPCSPILGLCWGYVATSWPPVGPCCGRCWAVGYPPEVILGYVVFMTSPSFSEFCLKKLSPVACEAPAPFLQHHFSQKVESCLERAHPR